MKSLLVLRPTLAIWIAGLHISNEQQRMRADWDQANGPRLDSDEHFADVLAFQQADQRTWHICEAVNDFLAIL